MVYDQHMQVGGGLGLGNDQEFLAGDSHMQIKVAQGLHVKSGG